MLPAYFAKAIEVMERHRNVAFVFPVLQGFGDHDGIQHGTEFAPQLQGRMQSRTETTGWKCCLCGERYCIRRWPSTRLCRRTSRHTIGAWRGVFFVLDGLRTAAMYVVVPCPLSADEQTGWTDYPTDASLRYERVTIIVAFSGRFECWKRLLAGWRIRPTTTSDC